MSKLTEYAFRKDSKQVALDILGNEIVRKYPNGTKVRAYIKAIAPHSGNPTDTTDEGITQKAGIINVGKPKYGHRLMDITTGNKGKSSCVTLRGLVIQETEEEINGPGKVTKTLHIDETLSGLNIDNKYLFITDKKDPKYESSKVVGPVRWNGKPKNCPGYFTY